MAIGDHHDWHSTSCVDDWIEGASSHDAQRRPLRRRAAELLPFAPDARIRVLDLGGGYGEFSAQVLTLFPPARVCLQNYSVPMVERARQRLAQFGDRVEYQVCDLRDPDWPGQVCGPFDAVVSALAIHNLGAPAAIRRAFTDVAGLLRPGGCFFDLDLVLDVAIAAPGSAWASCMPAVRPATTPIPMLTSTTTSRQLTSSCRRWKITCAGAGGRLRRGGLRGSEAHNCAAGHRAAIGKGICTTGPVAR